MHGGGPAVTAGKPLAAAYTSENVDLVAKGCCNLTRHIENTRRYGVNVVVAINKFASDTTAELAEIERSAKQAGAFDAVVCTHHAEGGKGAVSIASLKALPLPHQSCLDTIARVCMRGLDAIVPSLSFTAQRAMFM